VRRLVAILTVTATLAAGCTDRSASANQGRGPGPVPKVAPIEAAGGACQLLDYDTMKQILGLTFEIAAAAQSGDTFTCVTQVRRRSFPDLTLSVTASAADETVFNATVKPAGSSPLAGVGKVAYTLPFPALDHAGPGIEIGWLAGNARLIELRLRLDPKATPDQQAAAIPKLVALAKQVDLSSI